MKILLYFTLTFELKFYFTLKSEILGEHEVRAFTRARSASLYRGSGGKAPSFQKF
jgi:hypothetical protein